MLSTYYVLFRPCSTHSRYIRILRKAIVCDDGKWTEGSEHPLSILAHFWKVWHTPWSSQMAQWIKTPPAVQEMQVPSLGQEGLLEEGMATHSSILAWRIPWTEETGGLQSTGSQRVRHGWSNWAQTYSPDLRKGASDRHSSLHKVEPRGPPTRHTSFLFVK